MLRRAAAGTRLAVGGTAAAALTCAARATRCPPRATKDSILPLTERNWSPDSGLWSATWDGCTAAVSGTRNVHLVRCAIAVRQQFVSYQHQYRNNLTR